MRFCVFSMQSLEIILSVLTYVKHLLSVRFWTLFVFQNFAKIKKCFQLNILADRRTDWSIECRFAPKKSIFLKFSPTKIFRMDQNISCLINSLTLLTIIREINLFHFIPNDLKNEMPRMNSLAYAKKICYGHNIFFSSKSHITKDQARIMMMNYKFIL